ncbi:MAG: Rne/Rng family ribonuclease [Thermogemmata sp.]|nr:Rne/Rng family ribonuclease [Thermogemmata fonticola]MCX8140240.1 Rne/Rng family ribonuclease [Gemmataceae bacterium]
MKKKEMLINVLQPEECRIAIVEDGILEELYIERASQESYVGNIYKGRIVNIEPSIQAAFVDFGIGRNGFLHVSDVDPAYYKHLLTKEQWEEYERALLMEQEEPSASSRRGSRRGRGEREGREMPPRLSSREAAPIRTPSSIPPAEISPAPALGSEEDYEEEEFAAGIIEDLPDNSEQVPPSAAPATAEDVSLPSPPEDKGYTPDLEDEEFAAGIDDVVPSEPPQSAIGLALQHEELGSDASEPSDTRADVPSPPVPQGGMIATSAELSEEEEFSAGLWEEGETAPSVSPENSSVEAAPSDSGVERRPPGEVELPEGGETFIVEEKKTASTEEQLPPSAANAPSPTASGASNTPNTGLDMPAVESGKPKRRRGGRNATSPETATSATTGGTEETPSDSSAKPRVRRTRRKSKDASDPAASQDMPAPPSASEEDKPRYMEGAEHRTVPTDDDDILPFYEGIEGFDPQAPNDRFVPSDKSEKGLEEVTEEAVGGTEWLPTEPEPAEQAEEEARALAREQWEEVPSAVPASEEGYRQRSGRGPGRGGERRSSRSNGGATQRSGRDRGLPKPKIEQIFKRGQEVIVQVIKEAVGTKGPTLSTYISIAGRYLVLMPSLNRVGVSRKIEDPEARRRLRNMMHALNPPKGVGFIVRTAAVDRDISELRSDLIYLLRLWQVVVRRIKRVAAPVEIYRESDMITRTIRDIFTSDIDTIWVDEPNAFAHASEFLQIVMPKFANRIRYYDSTEPLFHRYGLEEEIAKIYQKRIDLPLGGSIVIEQTEALVAIDVNSGNFRAENNNAEETAFQMNLQAAKEIARQLRLRDLGGVIVNDFIDMRNEVHRRKVEEALREALKRDRARTKILRISQFGIIEMTRQRIRPSIKRSLFADCPYCNGNGYVKTTETVAIEAMRLLQLAAHRAPAVATVQLTVQLDVAHYLLNKRRKEISALEDRAKIAIQITGQPHVSPDTLVIRCFDHNGNETPLQTKTPKLSGGRIPNGLNRPKERRQLPAPD